MERQDMPDADIVREALRAEAASHQPDREMIMRRLERGKASARAPFARRGRLPRRSGFLVTAIAAVIGLSVAGTWAAAGRYTATSVTGIASPSASAPQAGPMVGNPTASPSHSATRSPDRSPSPSPARSTTMSPDASPTPSTTPSGTAAAPAPSAGATPAATHVQDGYLWSDGSVDPHSTDFWAQSNITIKTGQALTGLTVELRVALTPGVQSTGSWSTLPAGDVDTTVTRQGSMLVYRFTLKAGVTMAPGSYEFAGQYNHAPGGRDAGQDTYAATAAVAAGPSAQVWGNFYPTH